MKTNVTVDAAKTAGPVRAMHAVGRPPFPHTDGVYARCLAETRAYARSVYAERRVHT